MIWMSRDLTPREVYALDQYNREKGHGSLWDFMKNLTLTIDGETSPFHPPEEISLREQFPLLGMLLNDFPSFYERLSKYNGGVELLHQKDNELATYIASGNKGEDSDVIKWFNGTLYSSFFYSNTNDAKFLSSLCEQARQMVLPRPERSFGDSTNTKVNYLYRDASNYKAHNECVIRGVLTKEQQSAILGCLHEGEYFIPSQVGLPEHRFEDQDGITEDDHCWFELNEFGFEATQEAPTVGFTAEELVAAFQQRKDNWDDTRPIGSCLSLEDQIALAKPHSSQSGKTLHTKEDTPCPELTLNG